MIERESTQRSLRYGVATEEIDQQISSRIPLSMMQKTAARRMLQSAREIPQFSISNELEADELAELRSRINGDVEDEESRVSFTALLIWLTANALLKHPRLNGRYDEDAVLQHEYVNMAVAIDTPQGLTVPVIHRAETLSVYQTAAALRDLVARAGAKRLSPSDFKDVTFTMSNLGMLGVTRFTPLINPPQAAIMGVGAPKNAVRTDPKGKFTLARTMEVTVTGDHRILDGAEVARFLKTLLESVKSITEADAWRNKEKIGGESK